MAPPGAYIFNSSGEVSRQVTPEMVYDFLEFTQIKLRCYFKVFIRHIVIAS